MHLLSVPEYAEYIGISTQAVYKQIQKNKLPYTEKLENGKKVKYIVVNEEQPNQPIDNQPVEQPIKPTKPVEQPHSQISSQLFEALTQQFEALQNTIEILQKQLEVKDNQLEVKDSQIAELQKMLANSQKLQAQSNTLLLQAKEEPHQNQMPL